MQQLEKLYGDETKFQKILKATAIIRAMDGDIIYDRYSLLDAMTAYTKNHKIPIHVYESMEGLENDYDGDGFGTINGDPLLSAQITYFNGEDGTIRIGMNSIDRDRCGYDGVTKNVAMLCCGREAKDLSGLMKFTVSEILRLDIVLHRD